MARLGAITLAVVAVLGVFDGALRLVGTPPSFLQAVAIDDPTVLHARLRAFAEHEGQRVLVLGDSVALGAVMAEHGVPRWRQHTLDAALARRLGDGALVLNLALNGANPGDVERIVKLAAPTAPDLVVFDATLRSFSADFAEAPLTSRTWLDELEPREDGRYRLRSTEAGVLTRFEQAAHTAAVNHWALYRLRSLAQQRLFGGSLRGLVIDLRDSLQAATSPAPPADPFAEMEAEMALLMKANARYATARPGPKHPQWQALERTLDALAASGTPTVVFYATESPAVRDQLLDDDQRAAGVQALAALVAESGPTARFLEPDDSAPADRFLDHVHLDPRGYERLADRIAAAWTDLEGKPR